VVSFSAVFAALEAGKKVRQRRFQSSNYMQVINGVLCMVVNGKASPHDLAWYEMQRKDWQIL